jgi:hypothetical protein
MDFLRGCVDTGAPRTVCGKRAAQALCDNLGIRFDLLPSFNRFKFASEVCPSMGRIHIPLQTPAGNKSLQVEIVDTDIPLLLGLDFMDGMKVNANTLTNRLESCEGWSFPLTRFGGHIYLDWSELHNTMFNESQLEKLHRQFYHPSADKLYNLIKRARPDQVHDETRNILQEITSTCHPCQMMARKPISFTVGSAKDNEITFNREIAMDIVYLAGKPALHIIDIDTLSRLQSFYAPCLLMMCGMQSYDHGRMFTLGFPSML